MLVSQRQHQGRVAARVGKGTTRPLWRRVRRSEEA